ncbi:MAG TPA: methylated-DNA--[protein]-cysteine S-methyltransferase [Spirochaetota bacterium]|nr:methylated-DNA--[protein]-cysteine S-methyltransferase [Spirochaetota bacterium]
MQKFDILSVVMNGNLQIFPNSPLMPKEKRIEIILQNNLAADLFLSINYSFAEVFFGKIIICSAKLGVCYLAPVTDEETALNLLKKRFPGSSLTYQTDEFQQSALSYINIGKSAPIKLHIKGTNFQLSVWRELLNIPFGSLSTYGNVAEKIGRPGSSRSVGAAIGQNPVAYVIPCHRVIKKNGDIGGYRWGLPLKKKLIEYEIQ